MARKVTQGISNEEYVIEVPNQLYGGRSYTVIFRELL